jgi:hypothetical protein
MSSDDDLFWNHPNTAFVIFSGATPTILLALMFFLWAGQQPGGKPPALPLAVDCGPHKWGSIA